MAGQPTATVCADCDPPRPGPHTWLTPDGPYPLCATCILRLLADVEIVGTTLIVSVQPAPAVIR